MSKPLPHVSVRDAILEEILVQPALIGWHDDATKRYQHLGRLSGETHKTRANLTLWIGAATGGARELLVNFHLPITTRPTQSKTKKDMYLVIPAEDLHLDVSLVPGEDMPEITLPQIKDIKDYRTATFLHARFALRDAAYVIMPSLSRKLERPLAGAPSQLVSSLRALTMVKEFDVYLYSGRAEPNLRAISASLHRVGCKTPSLNLHSTYRGGCGGGKNIWDSYPCRDTDNASPAWNPLVEDAPPAYHDVVRESSSEKALEVALEKALHKASTLPHDVPPPEADGLCFNDASSAETRLIWRTSPQPLHEQIRAVDTAPQISIGPAQGQKRKAAEAMSDDEGPMESRAKARLEQAWEYLAVYEGTTEPESSEAVPAASDHEAEAPPADVRSVQNSPVQPRCPVLLDQGTQTDADDHPSSAELAPALPLHAEHRHEGTRLNTAVAHFLRRRAPNAPPSPVSSHLRTPRLFLELKEWLACAWAFDPAAHDTSRDHLLALGAAARRGDVEKFDEAMRECQRRLLRDASASAKAAAVACEASATEQVFGMLEWLNARVCRNAGTLAMGLLVELRGCAERVDGGVDGEERGRLRERLRERWRERLAGAYAAVFFAFGGLVQTQDRLRSLH